MIDIHCHILPGLDDGPSDIEESLDMARIAAEDGIRTIVATPHMFTNAYEVTVDTVRRTATELRNALHEADVDLNLLVGADVHIHENLAEYVKNGQALTVNETGRYILLELPSDTMLLHLKHFIFELQRVGATAIITHPERTAIVWEKPDLLRELIAFDCLIQLTAGSLLGDFGRGAKKAAVQLLEDRMVHVIATDAHSPEHRPPVMSEAAKVAESIVGEDMARMLTVDIPEKIIRGERFYPWEPKDKPPGFFARLFGRRR